MTSTRSLLFGAAGATTLLLALACGGGPGSDASQGGETTGRVGFLTTDATTEDWSSVGIIIRKASLVLASDTAAANPVVIYDGSTDTTPVNLLQEDQISDLLSQTSNIPPGVYDRLIVEVDGAPANIQLVPAADPTTGTVPAAVDPSLITVRGTADPAHPTWKVLPTIPLAPNVTVAAGATSAVAVDFDLAHPAFIVEHDVQTAAGSTTLYCINFGTPGIIRHKPAARLDRILLRRHLGTVTSVDASGSAVTMTTEHGRTLSFKADTGANPTLFYNLDVKPVTAVPASTIPATVTPGLGMACTARYQPDGSLVLVRMWYTATPSSLPSWTPEGHITKVDRVNNIIRVLDNHGDPKPFAIDANTKWFFHGDTTTDISGGTGAAFLSQVERFFKVQVTVADPTATPMVATTVDIQRGVFDGSITSADASSFTYTKVFGDLSTTTHTLGYGANFSFWNFTYPGMASTVKNDFLAEAVSGIVLDNTGTTFKPHAISSLDWTAGGTGWSANSTIFMPIQVSPFAQTVTTAFTNGSMQITAKGATAVPVTVTLNATAQEQPLVIAFNRQAGSVVTVSVLDSTQWAAALTQGAKVRVFGVPDGTGKLKAFYVNVYQ